MASRYTDKQKALILRALTDSKFRRALARDPRTALGRSKLSSEQKKEVSLILAAVKGIDAQIAAIADELLCANGGGCGVA